MRFSLFIAVQFAATQAVAGVPPECNRAGIYESATRDYPFGKHLENCENILKLLRGIHSKSKARAAKEVAKHSDEPANEEIGQAGTFFDIENNMKLGAKRLKALSKISEEEHVAMLSLVERIEKSKSIIDKELAEIRKCEKIGGELFNANKFAQLELFRLRSEAKEKSELALANKLALDAEVAKLTAAASLVESRGSNLESSPKDVASATAPAVPHDPKVKSATDSDSAPSDKDDDHDKDDDSNKKDIDDKDESESSNDSPKATTNNEAGKNINAKGEKNNTDAAPAKDDGISTGLLVGLGGAALIGAGVVGGMYWVSKKSVEDADAAAGRRITEATAAANAAIANAEAAANRVIALANGSANQVIADAQKAATNILAQIKVSVDGLIARLNSEMALDFAGMTDAGLSKYRAESQMLFSTLIGNADRGGDATLAANLRKVSSSVDGHFVAELARRGIQPTSSSTATNTSVSTVTLTRTN